MIHDLHLSLYLLGIYYSFLNEQIANNYPQKRKLNH